MKKTDYSKFVNDQESPVEGEFLPARIHLPKLKSEEDIELAKESIKGIMTASGQALEELINLAVESQSARHYEALSGLIRALNESGKMLYDMSESKKEPETPGGHTTNNTAIFVGTTTELQQMIRELHSSGNHE